jgi:hypothetical protein
VLTRSSGDFDEILERSDLIVELIGGSCRRTPLRPRSARRGKHVVTANKQLLSRHGEELWSLARERGVQLGFEAAVAGVVPVIRVLRESLAGAHDRPRPRDRQRHDQLHPLGDDAHRLQLRDRARARRSGSATPRPTRPTTSAALTPRRRWRSSRGSPSACRCTSTTSATRGSSRSPPTTSPTRASLGLALKLIGTAERLAEGISVRVHPAFLYAGPPARLGQRRVQRRHRRVAAITEITMSGPGAGGIADRERRARRRRRAIAGPRGGQTLVGAAAASWRSSRMSSAPSTCTWKSPTVPACWRRSRSCSATQGASIKSVVQQRPRRARAARDGHPPAAASRASPPRSSRSASSSSRPFTPRARSA